MLGVILASILFGFHLGALFSGLVILLMAGYILLSDEPRDELLPADRRTSPRR